jgi:hypothetical protein
MDRRDFALWEKRLFKDFDEAKMTALFVDEDEEQVCFVKMVYAVCDVCDGKGRHVDPNIDRNGILQDEFEQWTPTEQDLYTGGAYDVTCYRCDGKRVIPKPSKHNDPATLQLIDAALHELQAEYEERLWENRMGW